MPPNALCLRLLPLTSVGILIIPTLMPSPIGHDTHMRLSLPLNTKVSVIPFIRELIRSDSLSDISSNDKLDVMIVILSG